MERVEEIARIIDPEAFASRDMFDRKAEEWFTKSRQVANREAPYESTGDPRTYPLGQHAVDGIVRAWHDMGTSYQERAMDKIRKPMDKAARILALLAG